MHGGNRTGRIFTGDRSGDWLFASLHRVGLAAQAASVTAGDGQALIGTRMLAAVRCAPPDNKPTTTERDTCAPYLDRELALVAGSLSVVVALGAFAWQASLAAADPGGVRRAEAPAAVRPRCRGDRARARGAGERADPARQLPPSQQNTFTGRLTEPMLDAVLGRAASLAGPPEGLPD